MKEVYYKNDFDFVLRLLDVDGREVGWPDFDWRIKLYTTIKPNAYEASYIITPHQ